MSKNYDKWEKLVGAVLLKGKLKRIALSHSRDLSNISDGFNSSSSSLSYKGQSPQSLALDLDVTNDGSIREIFLPTDHRKIISRLVPGKRVFLPVEAREFMISSGDSPERQFHYSTLYVDSRLTEAVKVDYVLSLDIRGKIKTRLLSPKTIYGAYLLFKSAENFMGLESSEAMVRFVNDEETNGDACEMRAEIVHLQRLDETMVVNRSNGWMEVQVGNFYVDEGDGEIEVGLVETSRLKTGLIVQGIEFRPLVHVKEV